MTLQPIKHTDRNITCNVAGDSLSVCRDTGNTAVSVCRGVVRQLSVRGLRLLAVLSLVLLPAFATAAPKNGDRITNTANITSSGVTVSTSNNGILYRIPTTASIDFLQYAPKLPEAETVVLAGGAYRPGPDPSLPLQPLARPSVVGSATPIDLSNPVSLSPAKLFHQSDPIFVQVADNDMNTDDLIRETVLVMIMVRETGDIEIITLTETGPATGVFTGYIPSGQGNSTLYDGTLQVAQGSHITATYTDSHDGSDSTAAAALVDPFGILFDSTSGLPVNGASITLCDASLELPPLSPFTKCTKEARVSGDDGLSSYPSTIVSGGSVADGSGKLYTFPAGSYRFPYVDPGVYRYYIKTPAGYIVPSTVDTATIQTLPGAPFVLVAGSRGEQFPLNPGPAIQIDVPLDPVAKDLWVTKTAGRDLVAPGEFITFDLSVTNASKAVPALDVRLVDAMPPGFRLRRGSVTVGGLTAPDPYISGDGRNVIFSVGTLAPEAVYSVRFVAEITAGAPIGTATNLGFASAAGGASSNIAKAAVKVRDDMLRTRNILMGRVTTGSCPVNGEEPKDGLPDVRVYLEDGSFVVSDKEGLFHFEGVKPGLHVVQMDLDSLPEGYAAVPCTENSRFAGRAFSQFVETQGGTLWRTDFHVSNKAAQPVKTAVPAAQAKPAPPVIAAVKGEVALELSNSLDGRSIAYKVAMRASSQPVQPTRLNVILPEGVIYEPGSGMMDGAPIPDPILYDKALLAFKLGELPADWKHDITFRGRPSNSIKSGTLATLAYVAADGPKGTAVLTPPVETTLVQDSNTKVVQLPGIILRPHFPTFGAELDSGDRERLDELARLLTALQTDKIHVTGHTDSVRIAPKSRGIYKNNFALSMARAKSVGRYLMDKLHLPPEKLTFDGKGATVPIASNRTAAGKSLNRRVEVQTSTSRSIDTSHMSVLKEFSGEQRIQTEDGRAVVGGSEPAAEQTASFTAGQTVTDTPAAAVTVATGGSSATSAITSPAALSPASAGTLQAAPVSKTKGLLRPLNGETLLEKITAVQVRLDTKLSPKLLVDGIEISEDRIGFRATEPENGTTLYSYIGIDFGDPGTHTVEIKGLDPFGNARFSSKGSVLRTGEIARIRVKDVEGNVADGVTPVRVRVELFDAEGNQLKGSARLQVKNGTLKPFVKDKEKLTLDALTAGNMVEVDNDGWILFQPVTSSGSFNVVLAYNAATVDADVYVKPKLRDWILVGLAEGTAGYNTASGNMESLKAGEAKEEFYQDGRIAFFAKGQIKGEWLLTTSYDSAKSTQDAGASLFQNIDPDSYYTLYGDSTQQQYDAASSKKLYVKIERDQFYAMYGDYDTGLSVTELSRYSRRMTGAKTEYQGKHLEATGFAAESTQVYQHDEIAGDGTSGLYHLKRRPLVINSDKITIVTRDRFRSEVIISSQTLSRFIDYAIDYEAGTIFFKQPIMSRDENFNPITILAEYEALSGIGRDYTYGGRVGLKLLDNRLKIGASHIHEGLGEQKNDLFGVDTTFQITAATKLRGEAAETESDNAGVRTHGYSYLGELTHTSKTFDGKAYIREQQGGFGLGQQMGSESATRKYGLEGVYRLNESFSSSASLNRQTNLAVSTERDVAEGKVTYATKKYSTYLGLLHAEDRLADGSSMSSGQITAGGKLLTLEDKLTLSVDRAQSVWGNSNVDFPTRTTLGAEYKINGKVTLLVAQEFTEGKIAHTSSTRLGIRSTPWKGGTLSSSVERQLNENSSRVFGNMGLRQTWQLTEEWKVDAGLDRSQTIFKKAAYTANPAVLPASGGSEDFTAVSTGATYLVKRLTWDSRLEYRTSDSEDKWGVLSGVVKEQGNGWAWSARGQYLQSSASSGLDTVRANIRMGLVYRPPRTRWIHLDRFDIIHENQNGGAQPDLTSWRLVNNYTANYKPNKQLQVSLKYGAKFVMDTISSKRYDAFTDHIGSEVRYDLTKKWDAGLRGSVLHSWNGGQLNYSGGPSTGYNMVENVWVSFGYNVCGFIDKDFSAADYTAQGPYIRFRMKFDQNTVKDAAKWLNKE